MDTSKIVGEKIKSLRESQSISMEELAQRSMTKSLLMVFAGVQEILSVCHRYSGFLRGR